VLETRRREDRSVTCLGMTGGDAEARVCRYRGEMPRSVTFCSPTRRTKVVRSGMKGEPSYNIDRAPCWRAMVDMRYMIQPVVVYWRLTVVGPESRWSLPSFIELMRTGPQPCTIHFGTPVVPMFLLDTVR
jgi:hypothetical protein